MSRLDRATAVLWGGARTVARVMSGGAKRFVMDEATRMKTTKDSERAAWNRAVEEKKSAKGKTK